MEEWGYVPSTHLPGKQGEEKVKETEEESGENNFILKRDYYNLYAAVLICMRK